MALTNAEREHTQYVYQALKEYREMQPLDTYEYKHDYALAYEDAQQNVPYRIDDLPKLNTTTATADDVVNLERVQKKGWSVWMAIVNEEVVTVNASYSKKNAPDAIAEAYNQKHAKTESKYFGTDGELNQLGFDEIVRMNDEWADEKAKAAVGQGPEKTVVDFRRPDDAAKFLNWYFNGETQHAVSGSGKSESKYITVPMNGKNVKVRVSDHQLPIEYADAQQERGEDDGLELSLYDVDPSDVRADGRIKSVGIDEEEAMTRIVDLIRSVELNERNKNMALTNEEREEWKVKIDWEKMVIRNDPWSKAYLLFDDAPDDFSSFADAPDNVRDDDVLARFAVEKSSDNFYNCSERMRNDDAFARFALEKFCSTFGHCSDRLSTFSHCSDRLRNDVDFAKMAIEKGTYNFRYCSISLRDDDAFARFALEKSDLDLEGGDPEDFPLEAELQNFAHCSERLQADPIIQAYKTLVEVERKGQQPDLTAFPQPIQDAWHVQTHMLSSGNNDAEARSIFVVFAKSAMEAEARRAQRSPSEPDPAPLGTGLSPEDLLPELADLSIDPYANHPAHAIKPASNDDGPGHDLHRGPR